MNQGEQTTPKQVQVPTIPRLIPLTKWNEYHPWPPPGGLRWLVFHEKKNGFQAVIKRVGGRVLIDEQAFFDWVDEQNQTGGVR
ncbi:MAG TPA: hypothetical protein P5179_13655 [Candidatus Latescibacteria bacterium]|nr:hypothetical protein [Candidatus Latescibacterota bacterium]